MDIGNSDTVAGRFRGAVLDGFWRLTSQATALRMYGWLISSPMERSPVRTDHVP